MYTDGGSRIASRKLRECISDGFSVKKGVRRQERTRRVRKRKHKVSTKKTNQQRKAIARTPPGCEPIGDTKEPVLMA